MIFKNVLRQLKKKSERGQAMLLIALAFIGLVAFIGLAIDAGILFAHIGHLRRGVDAAALSAANQIRQNVTLAQQVSSAEELILLNLPATSPSALSVVVETCESVPLPPELDNCEYMGLKRKLARVEAELGVDLAFLPIVGWDHVDIKANAISEAASIDLVIVIDNSTSMAYDFPGPTPTNAEIAQCNLDRNCEPFETVRSSAKTLVSKMYEQYDQVAVVTFNKFAGRITGNPGEADETPLHEADFQLSTNKAAAIAAIDLMEVYPNVNRGALCPDWNPPTEPSDPRGCMRTNHAAGLMIAGMELTSPRARAESVKVVVLLSDGVANAAYLNNAPFTPYLPIADDWYCPGPADPSYWYPRTDGHDGPWCTDGDPYKGYQNPSIGTDADHYNDIRDPDDAARFFADWLGCLPAGENDGKCNNNGIGAVLFTIGLGDGVTNRPTGPVAYVGADLLRYIARVGYNGQPRFQPDSPCWGISDRTVSCGNYYYAPTPAQLDDVFDEIANRIFTRLTH
ncbi:MAG: hypothetical protein GTO18_08320 [Anaerolineales bacterium]|nr:hypothetical protein [Anaerolineales bacterium]